MLANDSILVTSGTGATLATHLGGSKELETHAQASIGGSVHLTDAHAAIIEGMVQNDSVSLNQTTNPIALIRNPDSTRSLSLLGLGFQGYINNVPAVAALELRRINGATGLAGGGAGISPPVRLDSAYPNIANLGYFPNFGALISVTGGISSTIGRLTPSVLQETVSTFAPENISRILVPNVGTYHLPDHWRLPGRPGAMRLPPGGPTGPWDLFALYMEVAVASGDMRIKFWVRCDEVHS